jgi:hypothetical protein
MALGMGVLQYCEVLSCRVRILNCAAGYCSVGWIVLVLTFPVF